MLKWEMHEDRCYLACHRNIGRYIEKIGGIERYRIINGIDRSLVFHPNKKELWQLFHFPINHPLAEVLDELLEYYSEIFDKKIQVDRNDPHLDDVMRMHRMQHPFFGKNISQFAYASEISRQYVYDLENGEFTPSVKLLAKWFTALGYNDITVTDDMIDNELSTYHFSMKAPISNL